MRRIFASQRLETVEGVARLLNDAGIETWTEQRRAYKGKRRSRFSYSNPQNTTPAIWIVRSEDQTRARALLREAGLIESTRDEHAGLKIPTRDEDAKPAGFRIRRVLLMAIGIIAALNAARHFGWLG